jgi:hypothetical protein
MFSIIFGQWKNLVMASMLGIIFWLNHALETQIKENESVKVVAAQESRDKLACMIKLADIKAAIQQEQRMLAAEHNRINLIKENLQSQLRAYQFAHPGVVGMNQFIGQF